MRFTTWSALTNAFTISTVALLWLTQAANAIPSNNQNLDVDIVSPYEGYEKVPGNEMTIVWKSTASGMTLSDASNVQGNIFLMNDDYNSEYILQYKVQIGDLMSTVTLPVRGVFPSTKYYIGIKTLKPPFINKSEYFTIAYR